MAIHRAVLGCDALVPVSESSRIVERHRLFAPRAEGVWVVGAHYWVVEGLSCVTSALGVWAVIGGGGRLDGRSTYVL